ncbi:MAG: branched-chain-fatty-acid kinase [Firmicutes bacterium]|nr:branched-chain-fatty-acid kinase [Bacillota bacterium]
MTDSDRPLRILVINPAATATHVAVFDGDALTVADSISHTPEELATFDRVWDQYLLRKDRIAAFLERGGISGSSLSAVAGRGGMLKPIPGGTYRVNAAMLEDLRRGVQGEHASNLGGILAYGIARAYQIDAFIVDPVSTDELDDLVRISGLPELERTSLCHALNMRSMGRRAAAELGKPYADCRLVVAHLGMGISVAAHRGGRIVDTTNANESGPFSPERAGTLPVGDLVKLCFSGNHTERELVRKLTSQGGLVAHLGTKEFAEVERRIDQGDPVAELVYQAMAYQIAKEIGAMAVILEGEVDAVVLTGPLAHSQRLVDWIANRVAWIGPLKRYPGGDEMHALAAGAARVLSGEEEALVYV